MELILRLLPSAGILALNAWLCSLLWTAFQTPQIIRGQAEMDFFHALLRFGSLATVLSVFVVILTFLMEDQGRKPWRIYWGVNAAVPAVLAVIYVLI